MNSEYIDLLDTILYSKNKLEKIHDDCSCQAMEDRIAGESIGKIIEALQDAEYDIKHYSKPTNTGILREDYRKKFYIEFEYGMGSSNTLSCGNALEVYLEEDMENGVEAGWYEGRVEHNGKGYYFKRPGKPMLFEGMRTRCRCSDDFI